LTVEPSEEIRKKEQKARWNHTAYLKRKAKQEPEKLSDNQVIEHTSNKEHFLGKSESEEFPEHRAYAEVFSTPRDRLLEGLNPRPMIKRSSDDPLAYGEKGTFICSIHGCPLTKRGCPVCNGEQDA
jgi:hypothetical protein